MSFYRLICRNAARNGFRSGVVFCCALLLAALPFSVTFVTAGGRAGMQTAMDRLGADALVVPKDLAVKVETALLAGKASPIWMPIETVQQIAAVPGVAKVSPQLYLSTLTGAACCSASELFIMAYDPATDFTLRPWLQQNLGRDLGVGEVIGGSHVFATNNEATILVYGSRLHLKGNLGRSGTGLDQTLFMTFETAREVARLSETLAEKRLVLPTNQISAVLVKVEPGADPRAVAFQIGLSVPGTLGIESPPMVQSTRREMGGINRVIVVMLVLVWFLSAGVAGLISLLAAHERRRELGILRSLGASRAFIFRLLLGEAVLLAFAGAVSGIGFSLLTAFWFHHAIVFFLKIPFLFPPLTALVGLIFGGMLLALVGVTGAAIFPLWRASRMEPALAMRE